MLIDALSIAAEIAFGALRRAILRQLALWAIAQLEGESGKAYTEIASLRQSVENLQCELRELQQRMQKYV